MAGREDYLVKQMTELRDIVYNKGPQTRYRLILIDGSGHDVVLDDEYGNLTDVSAVQAQVIAFRDHPDTLSLVIVDRHLGIAFTVTWMIVTLIVAGMLQTRSERRKI